MTRSELISLLSEKTSLDFKSVNSVFCELTRIAYSREPKELIIPGLGIFTTTHLKARRARHPQTGATIMVKARTGNKLKLFKHDSPFSGEEDPLETALCQQTARETGLSREEVILVYKKLRELLFKGSERQEIIVPGLGTVRKKVAKARIARNPSLKNWKRFQKKLSGNF